MGDGIQLEAMSHTPQKVLQLPGAPFTNIV